MPVSQIKPITHAFIQRVIAACFITVASPLQAQNLMTNGGFENGFSGWSNNASGGASASFSQETSQPYAGAKAMKVVVNQLGSASWSIQTLGPTFTNLGTGRSTMISFRARAATAGTRVRFVMQTSVYKIQEYTLSTAWTYFSWSHTAAENSPQLRIQYPSVGTVWLDEISVVALNEPASGIPITLDPGDRRQVMDGIGGALTWYASRMLSSPHRNDLEEMIFDDLGLDIIRLKNWYYPTNYPTNKLPPTTGDHANNKTFYDMAKKNGRDISVLFSSWSPPENLKSNGSRNGTLNSQTGLYEGTLKKVNGQYVYADFAQYWVDLLDNMDWTPDYLSIQNEPGWVAAHETCDFAPTQTSSLPGFAEALDAVYNRIRNRPDLPVLVGPESESMNEFLNQAVPLRTRTYLGINAFHNYNIGSESAIDSEIPKLNQIRDESASNGRPNWMSEFSKGEFNWLDTAKVIHNTLVEADASAYIFWKLVWGNSTNPDEIIFNIDGDGEYIKGNTYYAIKHFSKHISRGHQRFDVTKPAGTNANVRVSGYLNPAGNKITLIVLNTGGTDDSISIRLPGLTVASATAFRTRQYDIGGYPYASLGVVNLANVQSIIKNSITTYVIDLAETLSPYDPALLRVDGIQHHGNQVTLAMPSQPGQEFILWKSTTLAEGSWQKVTNAVFTEADGQLILTDPTPGATQAFYRVQRDTGP
jgi:O-glycosyl hydrolase